MRRLSKRIREISLSVLLRSLIVALCFSTAVGPAYTQSVDPHSVPQSSSITDESSGTAQAPLPDAALSEAYQDLIAQLERTLQGEAVAHPLDVFRVLDQDIPVGKIASNVNASRIHVRFVEADSPARKEISSLERFRFQNSTNEKFSTADLPSFSGTAEKPAHLEIWFQDHLLDEFQMNVRTAAFWGDYLVFTEQDGFIPETGMQNLLFVDLKRFGAQLGKTEVPIFRVPVKTGAEIEALSIENGKLAAGNQRLPIEALDTVDEVSNLAFNLDVNLSDPDFVTQNGDDISEALTAFTEAARLSYEKVGADTFEALGAQSMYADFADQWVQRLETKQKLHQVSQGTDLKTMTRELVQEFERGRASQDKLRASADLLKKQRRLFSRTNRLFISMLSPQPSGVPKLKEAFAYVASGLKGWIKRDPNKSPYLREGLLQLARHPLIRRGAAPVAAAVLASHFQPEMAQYLLKSLDIVRSFSDQAFGVATHKALDMGRVAHEAGKEMSRGFVPSVWWDSYVANGNAPRTLHGLKTIFEYVAVRVAFLHLSVNSFQLALDMKRAGFVNALKSFPSWFIGRQKQEHDQYLEVQAEARHKDGTAVREFTPEQEQQVEEILAQMQTQRQGRFSAFFSKFTQLPFFVQFRAMAEIGGESKVVKFGDALRRFVFSYASFTHTFRAAMGFWNYGVYPLRTFVFNPLTALPTYLAFPEFLFTSAQRKDTTVIPTVWNGGTRNILQTGLKLLQDPEARERLSTLEDKLVDVELALQAAAQKQAFLATVDFIDNAKELSTLAANGGIFSFDDEILGKISRKARVFHRHYFNRIFELSMRAYLDDYSERIGTVSGSEELTDQQLKKALLQTNAEPSLTEDEATAWVSRTLADYSGGPDSVLEYALRAAKNIVNPESLPTDLKFAMLKKLDPAKSRPIKRMVIAHRGMQNPALVQRVVMKELTRYLIDIPLDLTLMFVIFSGATSPELKPIQDAMFSNTSWNYLSVFLFKGWLVSMMTSMLANTWVDIQTLSRQSGDFGTVPDKSEPSWFGWYYKNGWKAKDNALTADWKEGNSIVLANMKSALSLIFFQNLVIYHRWDIDLYLTGYALSYGLPLGAISMKAENAFERSSDYFFKDFPEELRDHPKVIEYVNMKKQRTRVLYNFWYRLLWEHPVGYFMSFLELVRVPTIGPRSFIRTLWGGSNPATPTIWYQHFADWAKSTLGVLPGAEKAIDSCSRLLETNYPAWGKDKPRE